MIGRVVQFLFWWIQFDCSGIHLGSESSDFMKREKNVDPATSQVENHCSSLCTVCLGTCLTTYLGAGTDSIHFQVKCRNDFEYIILREEFYHVWSNELF